MLLRQILPGLRLLTVLAIGLVSSSAIAQTPGAGWTTSLSTDFHNVSGFVSVLDDNTLQFDSFTYDGAGIAVYFYLGASDTSSDFADGLQIGTNLLGAAYNGTQPSFTVDLPTGESIADYNAISVWCVPAGASFGSGTFMDSMPVPEPTSALLLLTGLAATAVRRR